jgi:hypothetical protein
VTNSIHPQRRELPLVRYGNVLIASSMSGKPSSIYVDGFLVILRRFVQPVGRAALH